MRVQRRVLRAVWLQVVGTRAEFGPTANASSLFARKLCPTIRQNRSMLVSYMPLDIIEAFALDSDRAIPLSCGARGGARQLRAKPVKGLREKSARAGHN